MRIVVISEAKKLGQTTKVNPSPTVQRLGDVVSLLGHVHEGRKVCLVSLAWVWRMKPFLSDIFADLITVSNKGMAFLEHEQASNYRCPDGSLPPLYSWGGNVLYQVMPNSLNLLFIFFLRRIYLFTILVTTSSPFWMIPIELFFF